MKIKKAVFPVAGFGTRFLPATKATPKEMLPVVDKPIIQYAVEEAAAAGIEEFIFITHHAKRAIDDHFDENHELVDALSKNNKTEFLKKIQNIGGKHAKFTFIRQGEPKGLGHAIGCAKHVIENNESFAVILADDLMKTEGKNVLEQMIEVAREKDTQVLGLERIEGEDISKFGVVDPIETGKICTLKGIVEKPSFSEAPSELAVVGRYIFSGSIFNHINNDAPGKNGEIQITDAILSDIANFVGYEFDGKRFDCGSKIGYLKANVEFGLSDGELGPALAEYIKGKKDL